MTNNERIGKLEIEKLNLSDTVKQLEQNRIKMIMNRRAYILSNDEEMVGKLSQDIYQLETHIDTLYDNLINLKRQIKEVL